MISKLMRIILDSYVGTIVLMVGILISSWLIAQKLSAFHLPGNHQGYQPEQPIAFSHLTHAGELQIACLYCHYAAETSRHAGIPSVDVCMNCHRFVMATLGALRVEDDKAKEENRDPNRIVSSEINKLYRSLGLNENLQPDPTLSPQSISWVKIHNLPDFVYFDHRVHVNIGISCQKCHGPVETMLRVKQEESLAMGWCINCHREANATGVEGKSVRASTDCSSCHY